jgi:hypothetical protein
LFYFSNIKTGWSTENATLLISNLERNPNLILAREFDNATIR